ncbi:armadillo repeat-containing protein 2 [Amia ocellicauda]|uniref:armadillo repeat-containing protein 2 n=1 Tax=Amia ocellicauda TaxID=2972642 RepID=UPI0034645874
MGCAVRALEKLRSRRCRLCRLRTRRKARAVERCAGASLPWRPLRAGRWDQQSEVRRFPKLTMSLEKKADKNEPFYLSPSPRKKTSAEIINEARRSLRTIKTQRPFTPRNDQRQLFGPSSSRSIEQRPPSAFSLHARNFEAPDSRPGSGKRLSPLEHKPKLPDKEADTSPPLPKPPPDSLELKKVSTARARLFRAGSLGGLPQAMLPEQFLKRLNSEASLAKPGSSVAVEETLSHTMCGGSNTLLIKASKAEENDIGVCSRAKCDETVPSRPGSGSDSTGSSSCASSQSGSADSTGVRRRIGSDNSARMAEDECEQTIYWNSKIIPVLQELESTNYGNGVEQLCDACDRLHRALEEGNMMGRKCRRRATLLKTLFKLIDMGSDQLNLQLAKLILALSVTGNNLLNVCKLIFKIGRSENNDILFQNSSIIDSVLSVLCSEDALSNSEAVLYSMGTLKFLSANNSLLSLLLNKDSVNILLQLAKKLNDANRISNTHFVISGHILVQLTAALRNLADLPQSRPGFLSPRVFPELCVVLEQHSNDKDICTNIARIFSKLSSYNECCMALASCVNCYQIFLVLLRKHQRKQDLVVRVVFTLGNLTAKNNEAREQLFKEEGSIDVLLGLLHTYCEMDFVSKASRTHGCAKECKQSNQPSEVEDVLIKLIRVLANLSIHPTVGTALSANPQCVDLLVKVLEYKAIDECEELVINAAATINNLSYYPAKHSVVRARQLPVAELLLRLLLSNNMEGMLEAARVFGNLSQSKEVRDFIVQKRIYKFMIMLLDSKNRDVCFSACGVLVNLTVDKARRSVLREERGIQKLIDCLRVFGPVDWQLASLICKTLWNYSEESTALFFEEEEIQPLLQLLSVYLDDVSVHWDTSEDLREMHRVCWEREFVPVAQRLRNRIQGQISVLEPLTAPS